MFYRNTALCHGTMKPMFWLRLSTHSARVVHVHWFYNCRIKVFKDCLRLKFGSHYWTHATALPSKWYFWVYWESNWLSISSQFDSNILQLLGIPGRILVPPATQLFRSKWLHFFFFFFFQCTRITILHYFENDIFCVLAENVLND